LRNKKQGDAVVTGAIKKWTPFFCVVFVFSYALVAVAVVIDKPYSALTASILVAFVLVIYRIFYYKKKLPSA
jgi:Flp pilus assembly protein TadB